LQKILYLKIKKELQASKTPYLLTKKFLFDDIQTPQTVEKFFSDHEKIFFKKVFSKGFRVLKIYNNDEL